MTADLDQFTNSTGYELHHDPETGLYEIKNKQGIKFPGKYTTRAFAHNALVDYLEKAKQQAGPGKPKKDLTVTATKKVVMAQKKKITEEAKINDNS